MASVLGCLYRNYQILWPSAAPKQEDALKIGVLGASLIA